MLLEIPIFVSTEQASDLLLCSTGLLVQRGEKKPQNKGMFLYALQNARYIFYIHLPKACTQSVS